MLVEQPGGIVGTQFRSPQNSPVFEVDCGQTVLQYYGFTGGFDRDNVGVMTKTAEVEFVPSADIEDLTLGGETANEYTLETESFESEVEIKTAQ